MKCNIEEFEVSTGKTCIYTAVKNIMEYNNYCVSEVDLFFLCNALDIEYASDLNFIGPRTIRDIPNISKLTGIKPYLRNSSHVGNVLDNICKLLEDKKPVLLIVDTGKLSYNRVYIENPGRVHAILLTGVDTEKGIFYIGDPHFRQYTGEVIAFKGTAELNDILESIYTYIWFDFSEKKHISRKEVFTTALADLEGFLTGHYGNERRIYGTLALEKYIEDFPGLIVMEDDEFIKTCLNINYNIRISSFMYIMEYLMGFLEENDELKIIGWENLKQQLEELNTNWNKVALLVLKFGKTLKKNRITEIIETSNKLLEVQKEVIKEYIDHLKSVLTKEGDYAGT